MRTALLRLLHRPEPLPELPPANLAQALGSDLKGVFINPTLAAIRHRLQLAAEREWASAALRQFDADPERFVSLWSAHRLEQLETERDLLQVELGRLKQRRTNRVTSAVKRLALRLARGGK